MKREHKSEQSYIDWLKSLGCKVYMPLTQGDLKDYISGQDATVTGQGSMVWNTTYNMYYFTTPTQTLKGVLSLPLVWGGSKQITGLCRLRAQLSGNKNCNVVNLMNNGNFSLMILGDAKRSNNTPTSAMNNWENHSTSFNNAHQYSCVSGSVFRKYYNEGLIYYQDTYNINFSGISTSIDIAASLSSSQSSSYTRYNGASFFLSNLYLFDTILDDSTIRQIQGYE